MQVKSITECSKGPLEHSAIFLTFIKLPFVIFVLSILEWLFYTGFTVLRLKGNIFLPELSLLTFKFSSLSLSVCFNTA